MDFKEMTTEELKRAVHNLWYDCFEGGSRTPWATDEDLQNLLDMYKELNQRPETKAKKINYKRPMGIIMRQLGMAVNKTRWYGAC